MCGDDKTGARVYSGRAADIWALGVCVYMWMFHRLPFEAPTVFMLMEAIRDGQVGATAWARARVGVRVGGPNPNPYPNPNPNQLELDSGAYAATPELVELVRDIGEI